MRDGHYSRQAVAASLFHFLAGRSMAMVLAFGLLLVLVRALDARSYGAYIALLSLLEIVQLISGLGLALAAQRYVPELLAGGRILALRRFIFGLVAARVVTLVAACALCYPLASALAGWLGLESAGGILRFYLLVIVFEGTARYVEVCQDSLLRQKASQASTLLRTGLRVGLLLLWLAMTPGGAIDLLVWIQIDLAASVLGCAFSIASLFQFLRGLPVQEPSGLVVPRIGGRRMLRYVLPGYLAQVFYTAWAGDAVKLLAVRSAGAVAFAPFAFAMQLNTMLQRYMPVLLLMNMLRPLFVVARGRPDYRERLPQLTGMLVKLNLFVLAPVLAYLMVMAAPVADWLTGGRLPEAGAYLFWMAAMLALQGTRLTLSMVSQALETGWATLMAAALGCLGMLTGWWCMRWWGLYALVGGLALSELLASTVLAVAGLRSGVPVGIDLFGLARILLGIGGAALITASILPQLNAFPTTLVLAIALLVSVASFLVLARLVRPFTTAERSIINGLLRRPVFVW
jgi:O-antigen/teichoic acid export membrane protein